MNNHIALIENIVTKLNTIESIKAIVLGGSYATGTYNENSDIDFGLFYTSDHPLEINKIKDIAIELSDSKENIDVTGLGVWGKWVNGGAWLTIKGQRIDFIYRNFDFVKNTIAQSKQGIIEVDFYQQPAYGFFSYIYCAEVFYDKILFERDNCFTNLKKEIPIYPIELKKGIYRRFLWDAEFTLLYAKKAKKKNDFILLSGSITRIINDLIQVLYALNEKFFINEKAYINDLQNFKNKPLNFLNHIQGILNDINSDDNLERLDQLINEIKLLTSDYYTSPFNLP